MPARQRTAAARMGAVGVASPATWRAPSAGEPTCGPRTPTQSLKSVGNKAVAPSSLHYPPFWAWRPEPGPAVHLGGPQKTRAMTGVMHNRGYANDSSCSSRGMSSSRRGRRGRSRRRRRRSSRRRRSTQQRFAWPAPRFNNPLPCIPPPDRALSRARPGAAATRAAQPGLGSRSASPSPPPSPPSPTPLSVHPLAPPHRPRILNLLALRDR
jgi:hypothetical protein